MPTVASDVAKSSGAALAGNRELALLCSEAETSSGSASWPSDSEVSWRPEHCAQLKAFWEKVGKTEGRAENPMFSDKAWARIRETSIA